MRYPFNLQQSDGACYLELKLPSRSRFQEGFWDFLAKYGFQYGSNYSRPLLPSEPLDTTSSRMQTSAFGKSKSLWKTLSEGTWSEAFDGLGISFLLTANPSIQYTVFDQLKDRQLKGQLGNQRHTESSPQALSAFSAFVLGALSKCMATCLTYLAIRCKVMIQSAASDDDVRDEAQLKARKTMSGAIYAIWKRKVC